jgi:hypothetical protein
MVVRRAVREVVPDVDPWAAHRVAQRVLGYLIEAGLTSHRKPSWLVKRGAADAGRAAPELRSVTVNDAQDHQRLPAGSAGARPIHPRAERASSLAVSWRGLRRQLCRNFRGSWEASSAVSPLALATRKSQRFGCPVLDDYKTYVVGSH